MKIRTLIIDDETYSRRNLSFLLSDNLSFIEEVGQASSVDEAYGMILGIKPQLIFLDIIMPPSNGFALLEKFTTIPFQVIFTTAYTEYAIQAIRNSACDYLLKPINLEELHNAAHRAWERLSLPGREAKAKDKIVLQSATEYQFIEVANILRAEMDEKGLVVFTLKDKRRLQFNKNLNECENLLLPYPFFRAHRAFIINLNEILEYVPDNKGGCVIMSDKKLVPIASRRKKDFLKILAEW